MSLQGNIDSVKAHPKFSQERTVRSTVVLRANATTVAANGANLSFVDTTGVIAGMYVSGNNVNLTSELPGFFNANVTVSSVTLSTVTLSANVSANVFAGDRFEFDTKIPYRVNTGLYNETVLVTVSRLANSKIGTVANHPVPCHTGWVKVTEGTGPLSSIKINNGGNTYSNGYITFGGGAKVGTAANAAYTVDANGIINTIIIKSYGSGYNTAPTLTVSGNYPGANAANATLTALMGGRCGRVSTEVLSVLSNSVAQNTMSGLAYFTGV